MQNGNDPYDKVKAELEGLANFRPVNSAAEAKRCQTGEAIHQIKQMEWQVRQILAKRPKG